jgi:hypothetical protein
MPSPDDLPGALDPTGRGAASIATAARGNGHWSGSGGDGPERSRRPPGPSTKPALIVLGITVALFLVGVALELVSGNQSRPTAAPTKIATARGAVLHAVPARPLLKAIITTGQPPDDLLNALAVPEGATAVPSSAVDRGVELYDRSLRFEVPGSQQDVISFFGAQLPALHWHRLSQGPTGTGAIQYLILEQHPASDGHEWDLGVTVSPTVFSGGAPTSGGTGTTAFTLRLYSVSDQA